MVGKPLYASHACPIVSHVSDLVPGCHHGCYPVIVTHVVRTKGAHCPGGGHRRGKVSPAKARRKLSGLPGSRSLSASWAGQTGDTGRPTACWSCYREPRIPGAIKRFWVAIISLQEGWDTALHEARAVWGLSESLRTQRASLMTVSDQRGAWVLWHPRLSRQYNGKPFVSVMTLPVSAVARPAARLKIAPHVRRPDPGHV